MMKFRDVMKVYGEQLLTESSFARIFTTYFNTGFIIVSADRTPEAELGLKFTHQQSEEQSHKNNENREVLRRSVVSAGFGFIPLIGGFKEAIVDANGKESLKDVESELSFLIPSVRPSSREKIEENDEALFKLGCNISAEFNQDSFLYKPSNNVDTNAYFVDRDGVIRKTFQNLSIDNMKEVYFSFLKSNPKNRLSFTEGFVKIPRSPKSATEARERYGELFWKFI